MPDYKEMYLTLFRATEQAINTLIEAQRECEELYISDPETELRVIPLPNHTDENKKQFFSDVMMPDLESYLFYVYIADRRKR